jgi:hypothetical protein
MNILMMKNSHVQNWLLQFSFKVEVVSLKNSRLLPVSCKYLVHQIFSPSARLVE